MAVGARPEGHSHRAPTPPPILPEHPLLTAQQTFLLRYKMLRNMDAQGAHAAMHN